LINGLTKNSNFSITTLFIGSEESAYQFGHLIHNKIERITPLGKFLLTNCNLSNLQGVEIIVFKTNDSLVPKFIKQGYLPLPIVDFSLNLRKSIDQIIKRSKKSRRQNIKKFRNSNYSYTIKRNSDQYFDYFYWKMYLPFTKNRFGKAGIIFSYSKLKALYKRNGGIVFVKNDEHHMIGLLFYIKGKTLYMKNYGVLETNQRFEMGLAGQAALFFLIKWAKDKGVTSLNCGKTMPFFKDGVFNYKKRWGMHIERNMNQPCYAIKFNHTNKGIRDLLRQNPFILLDRGLMKGVFWVNYRPKKQDLQHIFSKHFLPGLDSIIVIAYYRYDKKIKTKSLSTEKFMDTLVKPLSATCLFLQNQGFVVEVHIIKCQTNPPLMV
jgi:hypothetical protein